MWIEQKYVSLCSSQLRNFKKKQSNLWEFSCNICGDSSTNRRKARGYIFQKGQTLRFMCHNCGASMPFGKWLEHTNPNLYREYRFEKFRDKNETVTTTPTVVAKEEFSVLQKSDIEKISRKISTLDFDHEAYQYLKFERQIPDKWFNSLYFCNDLNLFSAIFPRYSETKFAKEPRIVIPIYNRRNELVGITARAYKPSNLRYIMLRRNDDDPLIFNLNKIDLGKKVYAFEGAFDSMFVDNAVAVDGADFSKLNEVVPKTQTVCIFDNQPRNEQLLKRIEKIAEAGFSMFVWPNGFEKDVNKNVVDGKLDPDNVQKLIDEHTYSGLSLKLKLSDWKKLKVERHYSKSY